MDSSSFEPETQADNLGRINFVRLPLPRYEDTAARFQVMAKVQVPCPVNRTHAGAQLGPLLVGTITANREFERISSNPLDDANHKSHVGVYGQRPQGFCETCGVHFAMTINTAAKLAQAAHAQRLEITGTQEPPPHD